MPSIGVAGAAGGARGGGGAIAKANACVRLRRAFIVDCGVSVLMHSAASIACLTKTRPITLPSVLDIYCLTRTMPFDIYWPLVLVFLSGPLLLLLLAGALIGGKKGAAWGFAIFCAGITAFRVHSNIEIDERIRESNQRAVITEACRAELPTVANMYTANSVLIESGSVEAATLKSLLGGQGLRFVEIKAGTLHDPHGKKNGWGITFNQSPYRVDERFPYVRFSLSDKAGSDCNRITSPDFSRPFVPFSPDACLRIEPATESMAELALRAIPGKTAADGIQWVLAMRDSGNVLVALTSTDNPQRPVNNGRYDSPNSRYSKQVAFGALSCHGAHDGLLNTLNGRRPLPPPHLALASLDVEAEQSESNEGRFAWHDVWVNERLTPERNANIGPWYRKTETSGHDWEQAYRKAESIGWATVGDLLLDYQSGEMLHLTGVQSGSHIAFEKGFMHAKPPPDGTKNDSVLLTRYSPDGRIQWRGIIHPKVSHADEIGSFHPADIFWDGLEVRIVGWRRRLLEHRTESWEFVIPRSSIGLDG
ncbi:hypothethical protein (plasmid) [Ralstonia solanacearum CMR15]|nr:hypothethical protein [Ralstonia solanacearum CMR15]